MEQFNFLVFNGLNLDDYEIFQTNMSSLLSDVIKRIGGSEGCSTNTSSWMNRFPILKNGENAYIILPSTIPSYKNVDKATTGKYAILLLNSNNGFITFNEESIRYFRENLPKQFDASEKERREAEKREEYKRLEEETATNLTNLIKMLEAALKD